jgi:uncharacterized damage-inducible protein DinB
MRYIFSLLLMVSFILPATIFAQDAEDQNMPVFCQEYIGQIAFVKGRVIQLAEAFPQEKYTWRPAEGIRSVSEVNLHTAGANYMSIQVSGFELPAGVDLGSDREAWDKTTTNKAEIIATLNQSFDALSDMVKKLGEEDLNKTVQVFGMEMSQRNFMITMLNHIHEHLGQSIAYARMNGVVPPWSAPPPPSNLKMEQ